MKTKIRLTLTLVFLCLLSQYLKGQSSNPATGGYSIGNGGEVCFTIGQVIYSTSIEDSGSIVQGVQSAFEIQLVVEIEKHAYSIIAFPNPANNLISLKIENFKEEKFSYQLLGLNGVFLETGQVIEGKADILLMNLSPSVYLLKVISGDKESKIFKIVKK